jgi:hypothetical protein
LVACPAAKPLHGKTNNGGRTMIKGLRERVINSKEDYSEVANFAEMG